jgi:hypothetical protein
MSVNSQITDSVTQVNTNVLADAPPMQMANLYQATSQAVANAAHNATSSQQQSYVTSLASTVQGVMALYSIDESSSGSNGMAAWKILNESAAAVESAAAPTELTASPDVQRLIDELSHETGDAGYHVRSLMSAFAASLDALSIANSRQQLRILQNAAIAVCMKAMIEQPDKARQFEETLEIIKKVV